MQPLWYADPFDRGPVDPWPIWPTDLMVSHAKDCDNVMTKVLVNAFSQCSWIRCSNCRREVVQVADVSSLFYRQTKLAESDVRGRRVPRSFLIGIRQIWKKLCKAKWLNVIPYRIWSRVICWRVKIQPSYWSGTLHCGSWRQVTSLWRHRVDLPGRVRVCGAS